MEPRTIQDWSSRLTPELWHKKKLHGLSPRANYTDRATVACRRSNCQLLRIEGATWSAWRIPPAVFSRFSRQEPLCFLSSSSSVVLTRLSGTRSRPTTFLGSSGNRTRASGSVAKYPMSLQYCNITLVFKHESPKWSFPQTLSLLTQSHVASDFVHGPES
jgi:hypothetical protein